MRTRAHGYAVHAEKTPLAPFTFERRDLRPNDVGIEILYCGVCHSDLHAARGDWDGLIYPNGRSIRAYQGTRSLAASPPLSIAVKS
jgi:hypothetical protein